jgi:hypothetical protein
MPSLSVMNTFIKLMLEQIVYLINLPALSVRNTFEIVTKRSHLSYK